HSAENHRRQCGAEATVPGGEQDGEEQSHVGELVAQHWVEENAHPGRYGDADDGTAVAQEQGAGGIPHVPPPCRRSESTNGNRLFQSPLIGASSISRYSTGAPG